MNPTHLSELKVIRDKAESQAIQNLNRYAIESLQRYDQALDSFSTREIKDSLNLIEQEYNRSTSGRKDEIAKHRFAIEDLTNAKASNHRRYNNILRKAGIAFGVWFLIVIILLQIRKLRLRRQTSILKDSNIKLQASQVRADQGKKLLVAYNKILAHEIKIDSTSNLLLQFFQNVSSNAAVNGKMEKIKELNELSVKLDEQCKTELKVSRFLFSLNQEKASEKSLIEINTVCETALEIAVRGASIDIPAELSIITRDLEKNLPKISVVPESINALLLNILNNAFQAVKQKHSEGIKGYQPKVILSTRILPRFLQVRIRDNGNGIPKEELEKVTEEFYSLRSLQDGAGLGLSDSIQLLKEPNKGEMKIESDPGNGTDVYIKFFL